MSNARVYKTGYIINPVADVVWYLGLPVFALAFALFCQHWLTAVAIASVALLINAPHNFVTLFRVFGLEEDRRLYRDRLIVGLVMILILVAVGMKWAPLTIVLLAFMWNNQHRLMQLHGFGRIYDHKASAGTPSTPRWDLWLNIILYINMLLTSQLFVNYWLRELYRFDIPLSPQSVTLIQQASWGVTGLYLVAYTGHVIGCIRRGFTVNPLKFLFFGSNYAVLYITSWYTYSILIHAIANDIMHGIQYIVIVYLYMQRKTQQTHQDRGIVARIVRPGNVMAFIGTCLLYTVLIQLLAFRPLSEFGFGVVNFASNYREIPEHGLQSMTYLGGYELFALLVLNVPGLLHLYYDSFIWKVRNRKTQEGL